MPYSRYNAEDLVSGMPWSKVDKEVTDALSVDDGSDSGVDENDYSPLDDARRLELTVHEAVSPRDDESETGNDLELNESELIRAWRIGRLLGMTGLFLAFPLFRAGKVAERLLHRRL